MKTNPLTWQTLVRCPACLAEHRILWPFASSPVSQGVKAMCPATRASLLLPPALVWAQTHGDRPTEPEWIIAEPYYG